MSSLAIETPGSTSKIPDAAELPSIRPAKMQGALKRFAISITILTVVGHLFLGFEQAIIQPVVALAVGYALQLTLEWLYAYANNTTPKFYGGFNRLVDFLLPTHIACLSIAMLMYFNDRVWIIAFAVAVAITSKTLFRVPTKDGSRHFLNPSNFAISATFLLFPSVGLTMPWMWTTEISGWADWAFPVLIFVLGTMLHLKYASRIWVVISFLVSFVVQALFRGLLFDDTNVLNALAPATGVAAMIFTFYMAPDPGTTPSGMWQQIVFGSSVSLIYMILVMSHIAFGLFFALTIVCLLRGLIMAVTSYLPIQNGTAATVALRRD